MHIFWSFFIASMGLVATSGVVNAATLKAGTGKSNISTTDPEHVINDSLYVKALVLDDNRVRVVIITIDVVALEKIGHLPDDYLRRVRFQLKEKFNIDPRNVLINASHCHGIPRKDVVSPTVKAVEEALENMEAVKMGVGRGIEKSISINRRILLKNGRERDIRHAYSMPADEDVHGVGEIDPEVGIMCLRTLDGTMKAVLYNFSCHPIQGVPSPGDRGNSAGFPGFASDLIEKGIPGNPMSFFIQGCAGDVNPVMYKNVSSPRNAETHGVKLGATILKEITSLVYKDVENLKISHDSIHLPLADLSPTIDSLEHQKSILINNIKGTSLNFKTFLDLYLKHHLFQLYPSYYAHQYLHEENQGQKDFLWLDEDNKKLVSDYLQNIYYMEELTVLKTNLDLLRKHQESYNRSSDKLLHVGINALKIEDFVLVTFPGELSTKIGMNIKKSSSYDHTYVSAYTNGYNYYAPTDEQLKNRGGAQEDSECVLDMGWQKIFEEKALTLINSL